MFPCGWAGQLPGGWQCQDNRVRQAQQILMKARFFVGWKWLLVVGGASSLLMAFDNPGRLSAQVTTSSKPAQVVVTPTDNPDDLAVTTDLEAGLEQAPEKSPRGTLPAAFKDLSPGMAEIIKLAQGGVSETVLLAYIHNSRHPYSPTVDEILFLTDLGVADTVISAMVRGNPPVPVTPTPGPAAPAPTMAEAPAPIVPNAVPTQEPPVPATQTATFETQPVNVNYFYSSLSPYGSWIYVNGSGYCWQPTVCVTTPGWRPYADRGHWIYTDAGWYWQSDYSWGWAAFHYGRWDFHNRHGWVWCPGSAWAPSWVTWRSYEGYAGWAPLPSSVCYDSRIGLTYRGSGFGISVDIGLGSHFYTFIPTSRFCDRQPSHHYVPAQQARSIYQNSTVINNYITGNNNTIINEGIGRDHIASATRTEIRRINIQSMATVAKEQGRREVLDQNRNTLTVYRPQPVAHPASDGAGSTSSVSTSAFTKHPPTDRRITIPTPSDQNRTAGTPIQKQTGSSSNPGAEPAGSSAQPSAFTKLPAANRRITIPTAPDLNQAAKNPASSSAARTIAMPQNSGARQNQAKSPTANQPTTDTRVPVARPSAPTYANNFATPTVQPTGSIPAPVAVNPDARSVARNQPSISVPSESRMQPQIIPQPRPVAPTVPTISPQAVPRTPDYTAPSVRSTAQPVPSQPASNPGRTSAAPPPQSQSQPAAPAAQNGGRNSSQPNQGANPRTAGSDRSR